LGYQRGVSHTTGRNDIVSAKASFTRRSAAFLVETRAPITPPPTDGSPWMVLLLDIDADASTGWLGYEYAIHRRGPGTLDRAAGSDGTWTPAGTVDWKHEGTRLELSVAWRQLGLRRAPPILDFKWADACLVAGDWTDFTLHGDAAPNDRFNYRARLSDGPAPR
jgi:hypothetical protein